MSAGTNRKETASMISDTLENAGRYCVLHPEFAAAFAFLRQHRDTAPVDGRYPVRGEAVYAVVAHTAGKGSAPLEAHRAYIDIQYVVDGTDHIGFRPVAECVQMTGVFDRVRDLGFFNDAATGRVAVGPGNFVIFFPEDAHAPLSGEGSVVKIIVKVACGAAGGNAPDK